MRDGAASFVPLLYDMKGTWKLPTGNWLNQHKTSPSLWTTTSFFPEFLWICSFIRAPPPPDVPDVSRSCLNAESCFNWLEVLRLKREIKAAIMAGLEEAAGAREQGFPFFDFSSSNIFHRPIHLKAPAPFKKGRTAFASWQFWKQACVCVCLFTEALNDNR